MCLSACACVRVSLKFIPGEGTAESNDTHKYNRLRGLHNRNLFSHSSGG